MRIGIDLEQFVHNPYGSGIQRVLCELARHWPHDVAVADFVVPLPGNRHGLLSSEQAVSLLGIGFEAQTTSEVDLRSLVRERIAEFDLVPVRSGSLLSMVDAWLLPEVSYLPSVLQRFRVFAACMPTSMIGYDTLPMTEPANYRFAPGTAGNVSEYFRLLANADAVIAISAHARDDILTRLRRDPAARTIVAHPGGDHVSEATDVHPVAHDQPVRFLRLGTLEARKRPREILAAYRRAVQEGLVAQMVFVGAESASDDSINSDIARAVDEGIGVEWICGADDAQVRQQLELATVFLSIGVEGYGIPVLEAIRSGTPVLFHGVQPAAELMSGSGAQLIDASSEESLARALKHWGQLEIVRGLEQEIAGASVPTWQSFAQSVAGAASRW